MAERYVNPATMGPDYVPPRMSLDPGAVPGRAAPPAAVDADELPNLQMTRIRTSLGAGIEYALGAVHAEVTRRVLETAEERIRLELEAAESWGRAQERRESASVREVEVPAGLDARPFTAYTIHCSHCGRPHEGEFGPSWWTGDKLAELKSYAVDEEGWYLNVEGRALVCPQCFDAGFCEPCDRSIGAWEKDEHAAHRHEGERETAPADGEGQ